MHQTRYLCYIWPSKNWAGEILGDLLYQSNASSTSFLWFRLQFLFSTCILKYIIEMMLTIVHIPIHEEKERHQYQSSFLHVKRIAKNVDQCSHYICCFVTSTKYLVHDWTFEALELLFKCWWKSIHWWVLTMF